MEIDLFAVQAYVSAQTYQSAAAFRGAMARLIDRCRSLRDPDLPAVAVFPEHIGTFLGLSSLGRLGPRIRRPELALALGGALHPRAFAAALRRVGPSRGKTAVLLALGPEVRAIYERTFADLARESGMTLVAGSALLPDGGDEVYNLSLTFDERGEIVARTRKVNLVPDLEDDIGVSGGPVGALRPAAVRAGRVGTLICYDGFEVPHTGREPGWRTVAPVYAEQGAQILAQPAANPWPWEGAWVHRPPGSSMLRREQWRAEGLERQLADLEGVRYAITAQLIGEVLGQRFDGRSAILERHPAGRVETIVEARRADLSPESEEVIHARVEAPWLSRREAPPA